MQWTVANGLPSSVWIVKIKVHRLSCSVDSDISEQMNQLTVAINQASFRIFVKYIRKYAFQ